MRYDKAIYFQRTIPGKYDERSGNYQADITLEDLRYAAIMDTGTETMRLVYGGIKQGSKTIHLQNKYVEPFDKIRIGGKVYAVDHFRTLNQKQSFVVSEIQGGVIHGFDN